VRLTKGADYGARGMVYLAKLPPSAIALISDIASEEGLPTSYLAKIFQDLAKEGIVRSFRGAKGGFALARPAHEISLREVIEAIEGPIALCRCLAPWEGCDKVESCPLYPVMSRAQEEMLAVLDNITLQELAEKSQVLETFNL
jgi:Rrf2 family transcriptional regulator, iron-sulfur cluster assembly transcription factor